MQPIPDALLQPFNDLLAKKAIPEAHRTEYRKWLRYFLDFRNKYHPPDSRSDQVRLFVEKLRSKQQSQQNLEQAAHALSLFFATQKRTPADRSLPAALHPATSAEASPQEDQKGLRTAAVPLPEGASKGSDGRRGGKRYDEWRCLESSDSPEWDAIINKLADEISTRHYSRKTFKTHADWIRNRDVRSSLDF